MSGRVTAAAAVAALLLVAALRGEAWLAWLVCAPLVAICRRERPGHAAAAALGVLFALATAVLAHAAWLAEAAERYFDLGPAAALAGALALCVACAVPAGALLGLGLGCAARLPGVWPVAGSAATWVAFETVTRMVLPYYPWIGLAATQAGVTSVVQVASAGGQEALSAIVAACGAALGVALTPPRAVVATRTTWRPAWRPLVLALAIAGATVLYGRVRLASAPVAAGAPRCTLAAVDARIEEGGLALERVLERYGAVTERAATFAADAIVWPESALPRDPLLEAPLLDALRERARASRAILLVGGPRTGFDPNFRKRLYNSMFRIAAGEPVVVYDKREPVPLAERWPRILPAPPAWLGFEEVAMGDGAPTLPVGGCTVGMLICFEIERPGLAAQAALAGADVLVVASNDAELPAVALTTEVQEARLRAVETGLPVLRAANRGLSVAIDRYGRATEATDGITLLAVADARPAPAVHVAPWVRAACWLAALLTLATGSSRARLAATSRRFRRRSRP